MSRHVFSVSNLLPTNFAIIGNKLKSKGVGTETGGFLGLENFSDLSAKYLRCLLQATIVVMRVNASIMSTLRILWRFKSFVSSLPAQLNG